jgi:putative tryptophan/tyrosine transport system substrate-binding protein
MASDIRRRDFFAGLSGVAAASISWPMAARAQQPAMPVIGFLNGQSPDGSADMLAAFREGLKELGFVEGRNVAIEYRWANDQYDRLPELAADLVRRRVAIIATPGNTPAALAAKAATTTIPIVFSIAADPVQLGLVASFNRPGGNVTGISSMNTELTGKRLQLLHELVPGTTRFATLHNPTVPVSQSSLSNAAEEAAARSLGLQLLVLNASTESDFEPAFATLLQQQAAALYVGSNTLFQNRHQQIVALAALHRIPTIYANLEAVAAGGLMSYASPQADNFRLVGNYTGRILKGEKPADLPVQQPTKVELHINMKTAKTLGLTFPTALLVRADKVIE